MRPEAIRIHSFYAKIRMRDHIVDVTELRRELGHSERAVFPVFWCYHASPLSDISIK